MGFREKLNANPVVSIAAALVVALIFCAEAYHLLKPPSLPRVDLNKTGPLVYYSSDDGKTWFADADNQVEPVDQAGRPAVRAYVYSCRGMKFVQFLEKYDNGPGSNLFVKKPGPGDWIPVSDPGAVAIQKPKCPNGETPVPVPASSE